MYRKKKEHEIDICFFEYFFISSCALPKESKAEFDTLKWRTMFVEAVSEL